MKESSMKEAVIMADSKLDNLRAMNQDNLLDENQLDQAAGGSAGEMSDDSKFLNVLLQGRPGQPDRYGAAKCFFSLSGDIPNELTAAWKSVGIEFDNKCDMGNGATNTYKLNGKQITQAQAWAHAEQVVGRHLENHEWNW